MSEQKLSAVMRALLAAAMIPAGVACAQTTPAYPTKPVRLLVGFAPGGGVDIAARIVAQKMGELMGQTVVVDNRAGAGGTIGTDIAAKAPADGYTLLLCGIWSHGVAPSLYKKLPYDHTKDFAPVSLLGTTPNILVVHPSVPTKTVNEFVALTNASKGKLPSLRPAPAARRT